MPQTHENELMIGRWRGLDAAAVMRGGRLQDLYIDPPHRTASWASIYFGRVVRVDTKLDAAFIDLGSGLTGFLPAKHVHLRESRATDAAQDTPRAAIGDLVTPGEMLVVQVKAEGIAATALEAEKLPRLTTRLYFPGRFLTYSPQARANILPPGFDASEKYRQLQPHLGDLGGWMIRAGVDRARIESLAEESAALLRGWQILKDGMRNRPREPHLIVTGPDAQTRALMDYMGGQHSFVRIESGSAAALGAARNWVAAHCKLSAEKIVYADFDEKLEKQNIFDAYDLSTEMDAMVMPVAEAGCGVSLIIEKTHAFTVIDVNRGEEGAALSANLAAAAEVARQIRCRNLSGAVLIDFISMNVKSERFKTLRALEKAFAHDAGAAQVHGFTRLQLIEITRKRRTASLAEKLAQATQNP